MRPRIVSRARWWFEELRLWGVIVLSVALVVVGVAMNCDWWPL